MLWRRFHDAAARDERLAEAAFAYERLTLDRRLRSLTPAVPAVVLRRAAEFFADVLRDVDGAEGYLARAIALAPGDIPTFQRYEPLLRNKGDWRKLGELYLDVAAHQADRAEQLALLRAGLALRRGQSGNDGDARTGDTAPIAGGRASAPDARKYLWLIRGDSWTWQGCSSRFSRSPPCSRTRTRARCTYDAILLYTRSLSDVEKAWPHSEAILRVWPPSRSAGRSRPA